MARALRVSAALLFATVWIDPAPAQAPPSIRHVSSSDATCGGSSPCYATVQAAVDAAVSGDTVQVQPGIYSELVRITGKSDLTVEGDPESLPGSAVIAPADAGPAECARGTAAVEVASSSDITLRRLAIHGFDGSGIRVRGALQESSAVEIVGMQVTGTGSVGCGAGIAVELPNAETLLAHNLVYANVHDGIALTGGGATSAVPQHLWGNTIHGNGRHGLLASGLAKPLLWNNLIAGNGAQPWPSDALPAYGVVRDLAGLLAPLAGSEPVLRHNLLCGNRSGELALAATETPVAAGNQTPTGSEGAGFAASAGCGDPAVLFADLAGDDAALGTLDDDFFPIDSSPAVDAGDDPPATPALDLATLQRDFELDSVRPADGDDDGLFHYDSGALEYGVPPTVSIEEPADGAVTDQASLDVSGSFTGTAALTIDVNGQTAALTGDEFEGSVSLAEGDNVLTATAANAFGSASDSVTVTLPLRAIEITSPTDGSAAPSSQLAVSGSFAGAVPATVSVNGVAATVTGHSFAATVSLGEGSNTLTATLANAFGSASASVSVTLPPLAVEITSPADGAVTDQAENTVSGSVSDAAAEVEVNGVAAAVSGHTWSAAIPLVPFTNPVIATASRGSSTAADGLTIVRASVAGPPPAPSAPGAASAPDPTVPADLEAATAFLYTGEGAIQSIPDPAVLEAHRVAVVRGRVITKSGSPLGGVAVSVHGRPELGATRTQADGSFDLAVNGGASLTLALAMPGYIPAQRRVQVPWRDYAVADDVVLLPYDPAETAIALGVSAPAQVVQGSQTSDGDGSRRAVVFFPAGTTATLTGSAEPLSEITVRLTEFTVGATGPSAMPGELPASSGYTYAVELSADEAVSAGAASVVFNQPVSVYVENFLGMPVGAIVPFGSYDYATASWVPETNGTVIEIDAIADGKAVVLPPSVVLSDDERAKLAELYGEKQTLWRSTISHFTPMDKNYPRGFPAGAQNPAANDVQAHTPIEGCPTNTCGSVIENETQVLGERIDLAETPYSLHYRSSRVPGYAAARTIRIPVTVGSPPTTVQRVHVTVDVAGRRSTYSFPRTGPSYFPFTWDGLDAYGRTVSGIAKGKVRVGWVYPAVYQEPRNVGRSFAQPSETQVQIVTGREEAIAWRSYDTSFGPLDARGFAVGGWTLSPHHVYDPDARVLHRGDGLRQSALGVNQVIRHLAGVGSGSSWSGSGVPGPAAQVSLPQIASLAVAPDGTLYVGGSNRVAKITRDGWMSFVTASSSGLTPANGVAAAQAYMQSLRSLAVGADGSLFMRTQSRIWRVGADGTLAAIAGNGTLQSPCSNPLGAEGALATTLTFCQSNNNDIEVGPDGSVYFSNNTTNIRRVRPDGIVETVVGGGNQTVEGVPARRWDGGVAPIKRFTLDRDGRLYFSAEPPYPNLWPHVYSVRPEDSIVQRVAGGGSPADGLGDGLPATQGQFKGGIDDLAPAPDGGIYVVDKRTVTSPYIVRIRHFKIGGTLRTVVGNGTAGIGGNGRGAAQAPIASITKPIATSPDGSLYLFEQQTTAPETNQIRVVAPNFPTRGAGEITIAAEHGSELYDFDAKGRHLRTRHALTGRDLREFEYAGGRLTAIRELAPSGNAVDDLVTTIERNASGQPTAIVGPYGARTDLAVDASGYLASVTNPADETHTLVHSESGLLQTFTPPGGGDHTFIYDTLGLVVRDDDPLGGFTELARTEDGEDIEVEIETALGRVKTVRLEPTFLGAQRRVFTDAAGLQSTLEEAPGEIANTSTADGTDTNVTYGPDPRLGLAVPIAEQEVATTANLTRTRTQTRTATVDAQGNLTYQTDTILLNGRETVVAFDSTTRRRSTRSPLVRRLLEDLDPQGRLVRRELQGLEAVTVGRDGRGRLTSTSQGTGADERATAFAYHPDGNLASVTDALSRTTTFAYDAAGRITRVESPGGRETLFAYDANGNLTSLTPPGQPAHVFRYTLLDQEEEYEPPAVDAGDPRTIFTYDLDRDLTRIDRPDGDDVELDYDAAGRLSTLTTLRGTVTQAYYGAGETASGQAPGRVKSLEAPGGEGLTFSYDGFLPRRTTWSGSASGYVEHGYDSDFRVASQSINGGSSVSFGYDADSLLTSAGSLSLTRHAQTGLVTGTSLGLVATTTGHDGFGEVTSESATVSGNPLYATTFTRDELGRITQQVETIEGVTTTTDYRNDTAGRLDQVKQGGAVVRTYTYDANGNRTSVVDAAAGTTSGSYDGQDRITSYGATTYAHDAAGDLQSKTVGTETTEYVNDALDNLTRVELPDGTEIEYAIDGLNRRVAKRVDGTLVRAWLYQDALNPVAELDGSGNVVSRFVYGEKANVPAYLVQGGTTYRILSDHLGSVRLVVDASTGTVAQRIDYDEFGNITTDTNPGFQPFGFAGGIYDPDTGLTRFGARDYDPVVGRWTTKDPIRFDGGTNLYGYVLNDPVNFMDPEGQILQAVAFGAVLSGGLSAVSQILANADAGCSNIFAGTGSAFLTGAAAGAFGVVSAFALPTGGAILGSAAAAATAATISSNSGAISAGTGIGAATGAALFPGSARAALTAGAVAGSILGFEGGLFGGAATGSFGQPACGCQN